MQFFKLSYSLDLPIIGDYPQIQGFKKGYNNAQSSCSNLGRYYFSKEPDSFIDFDGLQVAKRSKLTDYMSASYLSQRTGMLVSSRLLKFLLSKQIVEHRVYKATLYKDNVHLQTDYSWIHYISKYGDFIDYAKSLFFLDHSETNYKEVKIGSYNQYIEAQEAVSYHINANPLVLIGTKVGSFDILRMGVVTSETFVNSGTMNEMIIKGFTGISFSPATEIIVE